MASMASSWSGEYRFLLSNLLLKDFRVRYRNMSLGFAWSVANPLVMMGVLTFIFTCIFTNPTEQNFPVFVMCGLVPFNFFTIGWVTGTTSLVDNGNLIKRLRFPREVIPISTVLANVLHFAIQLALLLVGVVWLGPGVNVHWAWLPVVIAFEIIFVCGLALAFSAINVYVRDTRYVVESANTILFWLVPIFYSFTIIPEQYREVYLFNPVAAVVMAFRNILLDGRAPADTLLLKLAFSSLLMLVLGWTIFHRMKRRFYDYL
jgi:lipopolysaccharide transport system permease protein